MSVACVTMTCVSGAVVVRVARVAAIVVVRMRAHRYHSTHTVDAPQPSRALIGQFDTPPPGMN